VLARGLVRRPGRLFAAVDGHRLRDRGTLTKGLGVRLALRV
jgi:hypothetical protein